MPMPAGTPWQQPYRGSFVRRYVLLLRAFAGGPSAWASVFASVRPEPFGGPLWPNVLAVAAVAMLCIMAAMVQPAGTLVPPSPLEVLSVLVFIVWVTFALMLAWCIVACTVVEAQRRLSRRHAWAVMSHAAVLLPIGLAITGMALLAGGRGTVVVVLLLFTPLSAAAFGGWGLGKATVAEEQGDG
jgi:hypothetical protein